MLPRLGVLAADLLPPQNPKEFLLLLLAGVDDGGLRERLVGESGAGEPSNFVVENINAMDCLLQ